MARYECRGAKEIINRIAQLKDTHHQKNSTSFRF